jgi:serine/threonine protein kinase
MLLSAGETSFLYEWPTKTCPVGVGAFPLTAGAAFVLAEPPARTTVACTRTATASSPTTTEDVHLHRKAAVKVLGQELADDDRFRRRFLLESQLAASLEHPHIVSIYAAGEEGDVLFLAMKWSRATTCAS